MSELNRSKDMEHFQAWEERKPRGLAAVCAQAVMAATACHELLEGNRLKQGPLWRRPEPDDEVWFSLYSNHWLMRVGVMAAVGANADQIAKWNCLLDLLSWCTNGTRDIVNKRIREDLDGITWEAFVGEAMEARDEFASDWNAFEGLIDQADGKRALANPAMLFFVQVALPNYLRHGEWPSSMLWRASRANNPDFVALDRLVRTDRRVRRHPAILRAIAGASSSVAKEYRRVLKRAGSSRPQKVRVATMKARLAGFMSEISQRIGYDLEAREISNLFDLLSRHERMRLRDEHLPAYVGTWRRYVFRGRKHWLRSLPAFPELESLKSVRTLLDRAFYHFGHDEARITNT